MTNKKNILHYNAEKMPPQRMCSLLLTDQQSQNFCEKKFLTETTVFIEGELNSQIFFILQH